jgi:hypothetical protein
MGWKKSAPYGASDLAKIGAGFLHKAERLFHGARIAKNLENSDKWYHTAVKCAIVDVASRAPQERNNRLLEHAVE